MAKETAAQRAAAVQTVVSAVDTKSPEVQQAALEAMVPKPSANAADVMWVILVAALSIILIIAVYGLIELGDGTHKGAETDKIVTIITTVLAGLLGLFIRSPTQAK